MNMHAAELSPATPFAAKLDLVLRALSLSRGRLAAALGVDKSLVGRWTSGAVTPSDHNLSRLTQFVPGNIQDLRRRRARDVRLAV